MIDLNTLRLSVVNDSLFDLTHYLTAAKRRMEHNEPPLNYQIVQDAQEMRKLLRIKLNQLQNSN